MNAYYNERTIMENPSAFPMGEPNDGFAQYFVGQSYLASVLDTPEFSIHNVTFEPGCRNNWHIHHGGARCSSQWVVEATTRSKARNPRNSKLAKRVHSCRHQALAWCGSWRILLPPGVHGSGRRPWRDEQRMA